MLDHPQEFTTFDADDPALPSNTFPKISFAAKTKNSKVPNPSGSKVQQVWHSITGAP
jgi:hypothetical protein